MPESHFTFSSDVRPICEIGMSSTRQAEPTTWLDVSCFVHQAELFRGRERFNERFEPGTASVTFTNDDGWADLGGTYADVAAAELRPGRQIRLGVMGTWTPGLAPFVRWLYRGFIDQATPAYDPVAHDVVTVNCIDALGEAGSSTAPTGALQGVNETAAQRINRVLDAVGWWGSKRKIDATTTTVQGTQLGALAVDHMGQAADSAGGVVFGDLDGDVVFRDIDWMLYDPDDPPDGTIGPGDPGTPPGDLPPYIDPTPGPVHDPDDPPAEHPPKVCVCADGTEGTLVEKGDNYRLYVKDGHLFYESSGTTWDMGPYSGGCTCVDPDGPERSDDPDEDGDYDISPFPPVELPPQFGVELLAWNDGGLADPPATVVTVAGIAPGHDVLLVVMVNALGTATNTTGLAPTIDGGGLDWAHRRDADQAGDGASSFMMLAPVGRDDPGTFPVTVTWTTPSTSRSHIVTVWKVVAAVDDYLERFDAGVVLYALTDSNPPDEIEPGDGPHTVTLAADRTPSDVDALTRMVDITIAQSLAEEVTGPFGAVFADVDPPWNYPPNTPPQPEPVLLIDVTFADDFERVDGPLGDDWVPGVTSFGGVEETVTPFIVDGHVEGPEDTAPSGHYLSDVMTAGSYPGDQFVEAVTDNIYQGDVTGTAGGQIVEGGFVLYCQANDTDLKCVGVYVQFSNDVDFNGQLYAYLYQQAADGTVYPPVDDYEALLDPFPKDGLPVTLRLEVSEAGAARFYVNGDLVSDAAGFLPISGDRVGFGFEWHNTNYVEGQPVGGSYWVEEVTVGNGALARKASWVAGWRQGAASSLVTFSDVNLGDTDIQSAQTALVLESAETEAGWRLIDYDLRAALTGVTPAGTLIFDNPPRPGAFVAVMVGATASADVIDSITVTGADFTRNHVQHKTGSSWGQGAIFTAVAPLDLVADSWTILVSHPAVESVSAVIYEVAAQADEAPVGAVASGVLGTNTAGSVNGADSITLSATGDAAAVVLAYIHVAAIASTTSGATTTDGDEWHEEFQHSPITQRGYLQTMSRAPGQPESTSTTVSWADVQTGTADTYSAVQLAVEIKPGEATTGAGSGVWLGGVNDPWNGTIFSAISYKPDGTPIWTFP